MEKILSLHIGHDATAMFIDEKDLISVSEERISRIKNFYGLPNKAILKIFQEKKITWKNINKLIITSTSIKNSVNYKNNLFFSNISEDYSNEVSFTSRIKYLKYLILKKKNFDFFLNSYLKDNNFTGEVKYYDHHLCHIASSYATYPIKNSILMSLDGGGDNINWSLYKQVNNRFSLIENSQTFYKNKKLLVHDTPADLYANTTKFLGFKRLRDEGKVMGLSASGRPRYLEYYNSILKFQNGRFVSDIYSQNKGFLRKSIDLIDFLLTGRSYDITQISHMKRNFNNNYKIEDVCCSLQKWSENITNNFLDYFSKKYNFKGKNLILSGGFFSNVIINRVIKMRDDFKNVYITPNMGDGGLVLGGIYLSVSNKLKKKYFNKVAENIFYGTKLNKIGQKEILFSYQKKAINLKQSSKIAADSLVKKKIIGIINSRMEFGPRALGNRSILANPLQKNITKILNNKLQRSDFMPFAPIIRDVDAKKILENFKTDDFSSRFMVMTYFVKKKYQKLLKNIIHIDNTVRAQIIDKRNNKLCYEILSMFYDQTQCPVLINTSFNIHEEPIVMEVDDAIKALRNNVIDLIINEKFVIK